MVTQAHCDILTSGIDAWNQWRSANPDVRPDLSGADLTGMDLGSPFPLRDTGEGPVGEMAIDGKLGLGVRRLIRQNENSVKDVRSAGLNLSYANLEGANLSEMDLAGATLDHAVLRRANLTKANLSFARVNDADFRDCTLEGSDLTACSLQRCKFTNANLKTAKLPGADLSVANMASADLRDSVLASATLHSSFLQNADLRGATLWGANLNEADLGWADLRGAELRSANLEGANVYAVRYNRWARYRGIRIWSAYGSPRFVRFAQDQDFIEEFRSSKSRYPLYLLWLAFADCGRSFTLWATWSVLVAFAFGFKYYSLGADAFDVEHLRWGFGSVLYYSVVTFTTLGFGDIVPRTAEAARWVTAEVMVGYLMLGGLISILATKLARRS